MARWIQSIQIIPSEDMTELRRIDNQIKNIILSAEGTIPGSRGFGLARGFLSANANEAANILAIELEEKIEQFIPEVTVASVDAVFHVNGASDIQIHIERRN